MHHHTELQLFFIVAYVLILPLQLNFKDLQSKYHILNFLWTPNTFIPASNSFYTKYTLKNLFIYLFLAALGLRCCSRAFSSCSERGLLFIAVRGLLNAVASLVAEHRLQARGLQ